MNLVSDGIMARNISLQIDFQICSSRVIARIAGAVPSSSENDVTQNPKREV
jgi:hypothetical protein